MQQKLIEEIDSLQEIWKGGYFEGDPLNPLAKSSYGQLGFISVLYATYLRCIKPYVNQNTVALEIGPGRYYLPAKYTRWTPCRKNITVFFLSIWGIPRMSSIFKLQISNAPCFQMNILTTCFLSPGKTKIFAAEMGS